MTFLEDTLGSLLAVIPRVLLFLVIVVIGWIVAELLLSVVAKLLKRVGFDRAVERGGIDRWLGDNDASQVTARLVYYAILLFTLQFAFNVFGPNPVSDIIASIVAFLPRAFIALVIVVIAAAIASAVKDLVTSVLGALSYGRMLGTLAQVFILGLGIIAALNQVGIATAVTTPVLIAVLATIGGVIVVGVGGGLIQPMRQRWERLLARGESEMDVVRSEMGRSERMARSDSPQRSYAGQGVGAAVDPSHPRAAEDTETTSESSPGSDESAGAGSDTGSGRPGRRLGRRLGRMRRPGR
ncbi:MAG: mechanosensitive ion channel family protein [Micromonosporaceae bacterium]